MYVTIAPLALGACTVTSATPVIAGPTRSATVTVNVALDLLPRRSVAVQVTSVVPIGNNELAGGAHETVTPALPASVAVGSVK